MTFTSLASSSRGNAYVVSDGETTLLLECGLSFRELQKRLGYGVADITACLVSHEHQDHAKAAAQMLKAGVPVYMSEGTAAAHKDAMDAANLIKAGDVLRFGHLTVVPFRTYPQHGRAARLPHRGRPHQGAPALGGRYGQSGRHR